MAASTPVKRISISSGGLIGLIVLASIISFVLGALVRPLVPEAGDDSSENSPESGFPIGKARQPVKDTATVATAQVNRGDTGHAGILKGLGSTDLSPHAFSGLEGQLKHLDLEGVMQAISLLENQPPSLARKDFERKLLRRWGELEGAKALDSVLADPSAPNMEESFRSVFDGWADADPEAALQWYRKFAPSGTEPLRTTNNWALNSIIVALFANLKERNFELAFQAVWEMETPQDQIAAFSGILGQVDGSTESEMLMKRLISLPASEERDQALRSLVSRWAQFDPLAAGALVRQSPELQNSSFARALTTVWMSQDPAAAVEWTFQMPDPAERVEVLKNVVTQWAYRDDISASEWLRNRDLGSEYDPVIASFSQAAARKEVEGAMVWADSIQDSDLHSRTVKQIYRMWQARDSEAARKALEATRLPPEVIKETIDAGPAEAQKRDAIRVQAGGGGTGRSVLDR